MKKSLITAAALLVSVSAQAQTSPGPIIEVVDGGRFVPKATDVFFGADAVENGPRILLGVNYGGFGSGNTRYFIVSATFGANFQQDGTAFDYANFEISPVAIAASDVLVRFAPVQYSRDLTLELDRSVSVSVVGIDAVAAADGWEARAAVNAFGVQYYALTGQESETGVYGLGTTLDVGREFDAFGRQVDVTVLSASLNLNGTVDTASFASRVSVALNRSTRLLTEVSHSTLSTDFFASENRSSTRIRIGVSARVP